ncbi:MAG: exodeoxyribonuclease VII small subunit [Eubacteriales bacterium]|nr:exodeoxyribonuclease VII small subunit [Oscillospiraceae bacterium]MBQ1790313.1 exodeoxyribonuclease VII small subunit [Oscillospiraceae bacterium]MBQ2158569.1 exodeoxyribonuclease VII small subunit [Oscillospiraceae bacterium]MBQ2597719.1 exodeoxyribonuclease VII small subunit [Oscillospiraceae bacterium]MBQ4015962.1 exodeoxyribonuclease VII small subunit [Oscillospiraceae bacterium]
MARKKLSFEEAMKRLEEIVSHLEKGDIPLEESIRLFEEGSGLLALCSSQLEEAEQKVSLLRRGDDDETEEIPFEE